MAGWRPPGQATDPMKWSFSPTKGWSPPGDIPPKDDLSFEFDGGAFPATQGTGWQTVVSPAGVGAPLHAVSYTPSTKEVHGHGVQAPIDKMNLSVVPVSSGGPPKGVSILDLLRSGGGGGEQAVGTGQEGGGWEVALPDGTVYPV